MNNYIVRKENIVKFDNTVILSNNDVYKAIILANEALRKLQENTSQFDINVFEALGMRNLSGLVGEYFAKCIVKISNGKLQSNLHQDGYPDLLLTDTPDKLQYFNTLYTIEGGKKKPKDKALFSPYKYYGLEVKACCGSTPPASKVPKPLIGEQRIDLINNFDWKAHHRQTNHLLAIIWDFIDGRPTIVACFYQDTLTEEDWGKIIQPSDGGGRTTSVSIMTHSGIKKMCDQWVAIINEEKYINKLAANKWIGYRVNSPR